jgi:hypothetical protein
MPTNPHICLLIAFRAPYLPLQPTNPHSYLLSSCSIFLCFSPFHYFDYLSFNIFSMSPNFQSSTLICWSGWGTPNSFLFITLVGELGVLCFLFTYFLVVCKWDIQAPSYFFYYNCYLHIKREELVTIFKLPTIIFSFVTTCNANKLLFFIVVACRGARSSQLFYFIFCHSCSY